MSFFRTCTYIRPYCGGDLFTPCTDVGYFYLCVLNIECLYLLIRSVMFVDPYI